MKLPFWGLVILFIINGLGLFYGWYHAVWYDLALHGLGGFFVAQIGWRFFGSSFTKTGLSSTVATVGFALLVGIFWEGAEYLANQTLVEPTYEYFKIRAYFIGNLRDSMIDFGMDGLGGLVVVVTRVWKTGS